VKIKRRQFLKLSLAQSALAISTSKKAIAFETDEDSSFRFIQRQTPSVLQGATDESSTQFSVVYKNGTSLKAIVVDSSNKTYEPIKTETHNFNEELPKVHKFYFSDLESKTNYTLKLLNADNNEILDERDFQCLDLNKTDLKFAFGSCMEDTRHDPEIWEDLVKQEPDLMFFIGDSVYADRDGFGQFSVADPKRLWERFCRARQTLEIYFSKKLIPCLATWDDHDFGFNDADSTEYPYVEESKRNFECFYAQDDKHLTNLIKGPGISSALHFGSHLFILMDNRTFRLPKGSSDRYAHWGDEQEKWLHELIQSHDGTSWIMNGSQMFPSMPFKESFSRDHRENFRAFVSEAKKASSRLVFCSGDVHFSEVTEIDESNFGYKTYELTSSSIHSRGTPPWIVPNLNRLTSAGKRNYILVSTEAQKNSELRVVSRSAQNEINFEITL
jgi:phosphodiesterase/alkaline phosphatase D-like protein